MIQMLDRAAEEIARALLFSCCGIRAVHAHPGFDEWANQPRPDGALMINGIVARASRLDSAAHSPVRLARASADRAA